MDEKSSKAPEPLMTAEEVAAQLRVSEGTVNQWVKLGRIPVVKIGRLNRFRRDDIEAYIASRAEPATTTTEG
jgi:excisionase family DNA binding protein